MGTKFKLPNQEYLAKKFASSDYAIRAITKVKLSTFILSLYKTQNEFEDFHPSHWMQVLNDMHWRVRNFRRKSQLELIKYQPAFVA